MFTVVGTQKNRLNETVLLSTQNTCLNEWIRKESQFYAQKFCLTGPMSGCLFVKGSQTIFVEVIIMETYKFIHCEST